jgi:hypothetical protein
LTEILAALAAVATGCSLAALVVVHLLPTGRRPLRDAVSDYGVGPFHVWYDAAAISLGIAGLLLAAALPRAVDPRPRAVVLLLVAFGAARIAIAFYPTDLDRGQSTRTGRVHLLLAAIAFVTIAFAAGKLPGAVSGSAAWSGIHRELQMLGWAVIATSVATGLSLRLARGGFQFFGLVERLLYFAVLAWFFTVSLHLV